MDTMQSLQRDGLFWLPNNPARKVGGRLTLDSQDGLQLQLFGSLQGVKELELDHMMPICIRAIAVNSERRFGFLGGKCKTPQSCYH